MIIRKKREWFGAIACAIVQSFIYGLGNTTPNYLFPMWFIISTLITFECVKALSTYDIAVWGSNTTRTYLKMYVGCAFGMIGGAVSYYILRHEELKYE